MESIFALVFPVLFVGMLLMIFTKKGHNTFVRMAFGKIVKDYGVLGKEKLQGPIPGVRMPQHVRLLEVEKKGHKFYVLEANFFGAVQYMKLSKETAKALAETINQNV